MNTATNNAAKYDLTTIDGINAMLDATQGERPVVEETPAAPTVKLTDAQIVALINAGKKGRFTSWGAGYQGTHAKLEKMGFLTHAQDDKGYTIAVLTEAGKAQAEALSKVYTTDTQVWGTTPSGKLARR